MDKRKSLFLPGPCTKLPERTKCYPLKMRRLASYDSSKTPCCCQMKFVITQRAPLMIRENSRGDRGDRGDRPDRHHVSVKFPPVTWKAAFERTTQVRLDAHFDSEVGYSAGVKPWQHCWRVCKWSGNWKPLHWHIEIYEDFNGLITD